MRSFISNIFFHISEKLGIGKVSRETTFLKEIATSDYLRKYLYEHPRYADPKKLNHYEYNIYSQSGEDGIIEEIFKRIGTTNKYFVEFGVSDGLENNSAALLLQGWKGLWIEGSTVFFEKIQKKFKNVIDDGMLQVQNAFITGENIESLFKKASVPQEIDLLSIDIDGNDFWVWKAITHYNPRVVVVECNPFFGPSISWTMKYNAAHVWDRSTYFGVSVKALEILGRQKGYSLVGCNFMGNNTFFVRNDLLKDMFASPYTSEHHFEWNKIFLYTKYKYKKNFGESIEVKEK